MAATGTILIADDEERILRALGRALREDGHDVVEASSGRAAQRLLAERAFDVAGRRQHHARPHRARSHPRPRPARAAGRAAADRADDGARDRRERHRGHEARRARLPAEAVRDRRTAGRRAPRPRTAAPAQPAPLPAERARRGVRSLRHRRAAAARCRTSSARSSAWRRRRAPSSSPARPAPARSWSPGPSTTAAPSATCRSSR